MFVFGYADASYFDEGFHVLLGVDESVINFALFEGSYRVGPDASFVESC